MTDHSTQSVLFPELADRPVFVAFDQPQTSSDAGGLLIAAIDRSAGLTAAMSAGLRDPRESDRVEHTMVDLLRQRVYAMACGYTDANDASRLREDPGFRLLLGRDPAGSGRLGSQPTLSRFESWSEARSLVRASEALLERVLAEQARRRRGRNRPQRIVIDLDSTVDPTHGEQQLSMFNGHYGTWCYLPLLAFVQFDDEPEQYLVAAVLRSGTAGDRKGFAGVLRRILRAVAARFAGAERIVRLDAGFCSAELLSFLEREEVGYVLGLQSNPLLDRQTEASMKRVRKASELSGKTENRFGEIRYGARSWTCRRRVAYKAEVVRLEGRSPRDNRRFVVTNLELEPAEVWSFYALRGDVENRIKELKNDAGLDRTSATAFFANQLRVLISAAAYALLQMLRQRAARTRFARAQVARLRDGLLKIAGRIERSVRRFSVHLASEAPARDVWLGIARGLLPVT